MFKKIIAVISVGMCCAMLGCAHHGALQPKSVRARPADVPVLLYHHIEDLAPGASAAQRRWTISPKKFEAQMDWLAAHGFNPVTMQQLVAHLKQAEDLPLHPIVLTFDDGWKDHATAVLPILSKRGFAATFFIISESVGHSAYMNWQQVKALSDAGMDIQSHTVTHPALSVMKPDQIRREIVESKKTIERQLNKPVTILAYPFGKFDDEVIAIAREAGMQGATTVSGHNGGYLLRTDRTFTLDRYAVENGETIEGILRMKGAF